MEFICCIDCVGNVLRDYERLKFKEENPHFVPSENSEDGRECKVKPVKPFRMCESKGSSDFAGRRVKECKDFLF